LLRTAQPCQQFLDWWISTTVFVLNVVEAAPPQKNALVRQEAQHHLAR
jgi:hypothetical protein